MQRWRELAANDVLGFIGDKADAKTYNRLFTLPYSEMIAYAEKLCGKKFVFGDHIRNVYDEMAVSYVDGTVTLKPHAAEFLEYLAANGVKTGVATATPRNMCVPCLEKYGIYKYFDAFFTTDEVGKPKVYPDIYEKAMQKLGGTKENTMVFEDARYCTKTLVENNFRFMIVRDDSQCDDLEELQSLGRPFVNDYADLMK